MRNRIASLALASLVALGCGGNVTAEEGTGALDDSALADGGPGGSEGGTVMPGGDATVTPVDDGGVGPSDDASLPPPPPMDGSVPPPPPMDGSVPPPPPMDASTGPGGIKCGSATCNAATQDCCASLSGQTCVAKGTCSGGATIACTDSSACKAGEVCCASGGLGGGGAKCATTCTMGIVLCATDAECKAPQKCLSGFGGYKTCRNPPPGGFDGGFGGFDAGGFGGFDAGGFGGFDAAFDTKAFGG
jgi:hypothetical protein